MSILALENKPDIEDEPKPEMEKHQAPRLGFWKIVLAVFVGNILTGLLAAFLYSLK
jgi:hypothetical protein